MSNRPVLWDYNLPPPWDASRFVRRSPYIPKYETKRITNIKVPTFDVRRPATVTTVVKDDMDQLTIRPPQPLEKSKFFDHGNVLPRKIRSVERIIQQLRRDIGQPKTSEPLPFVPYNPEFVKSSGYSYLPPYLGFKYPPRYINLYGLTPPKYYDNLPIKMRSKL